MRAKLNAYLEDFKRVLNSIEATDKEGQSIEVWRGVQKCVDEIVEAKKRHNALFFIGNGGSASIASHQATDFIKACGIKAFSPIEHSLITCMANDCGYDEVFAASIEILMNEGDILIAISSSGRSPNIICAVEFARRKNFRIITLSGFDADNPLRKKGDINFYVPSNSYRFVESAHLFICNWFVDFTLESSK